MVRSTRSTSNDTFLQFLASFQISVVEMMFGEVGEERLVVDYICFLKSMTELKGFVSFHVRGNVFNSWDAYSTPFNDSCKLSLGFKEYTLEDCQT